MDHSPKKKPQKRMLNKLKSWTKKFVASPKSNNNSSSNNKQPELNDTISQKSQSSLASLDDRIGLSRDNNRNESLAKSRSSGNLNMKASAMLPTIEEQKTHTFNMFSETSFKATSATKQRRNSFFGVTRLSSLISSRVSRVSNTTSNNNHVTTCNLPELVEEPFDFDFIFNDFDCENDGLDEPDELLKESNILSEKSDLPDSNKSKLDNNEFYNALPVAEDDARPDSVSSFAIPPNPTTLLFSSTNNSLIYSPRISIMGVECSACTYVNHPIMAYCELCRARLPGSSVRSSQCSTTYNNKSVISDPYSNILTPLTKTQMTLLKQNDIEYIAVKDMFYSEVPYVVIKEIKGIFRLDMPTKLVKAHEKYKFKVATRSGKSIDDVTFSMFHGTTTSFKCDPGRFLYDNMSFCKKSCGMCGIIQHGNKKRFSKHSGKMWFAHSALISRDYTDACRSTKVMFVIDVIAEEHNWILVVNKNKATLPRFMILFE